MKLVLVTAICLVGVGSATAADVFDAIYVLDPAACERAGEADFANVLFELQASVVAPRTGIWVGGELACTLVDFREYPSPIAETSEDVELYASARCHGYDLDFLDTVVLTAVSQQINMANGDTGEVPEDKMQIISMRADIGGEAITDGYAGIYTRCDALTLDQVQAWQE
ncbi:hypothetical protein [uncultured Devosia sp.]|uniref:hypothetical protein n=1 Tax=uncultured Devosia sp. TaxID=211434 RepID=UPI0035CC7188